MEEFIMSSMLKEDDVVLTLSKYIEVPYEMRDISLYDSSISINPVYVNYVLTQVFKELHICQTDFSLFKADLSFNRLVELIFRLGASL